MKEMESPKIDFSGFSKFKLLDFNKEMFLDSRIQIWIPPPPTKKNVHKVTALYIKVFWGAGFHSKMKFETINYFNEKFSPIL